MANKFLEKQYETIDVYAQRAERLTKQYMIDTLQLAIARSEGWGFDRIMRLTEYWDEVREEFRPALNPKHVEADVAQEHMDREMMQIIRGKMKLIPFARRYPELKSIKYRK